ncbi:MAG: hypothetical protein Q4P24_17870 [Rhodobacterales bacterium]|nr:hypothetical protein [Rhodobacterales bacterium]
MSEKQGPEHAARLRDDIDKGRTGDKVGFPDPAAAPLGTDAEAAGASPTSAEVRTARRHELGGPAGPASAPGPRPVGTGGTPQSQRKSWTVILIIVALVVIAFLLLWAVLQ